MRWGDEMESRLPFEIFSNLARCLAHFDPKSRNFQYCPKQPCLPRHLKTYITFSIVSFIQYFHLMVFGTLGSLVAWFSLCFFRLAHLALQNVNKDYVIFPYFHKFVAKSNQKRKMGWTKQTFPKLGTNLSFLKKTYC